MLRKECRSCYKYIFESYDLTNKDEVAMIVLNFTSIKKIHLGKIESTELTFNQVQWRVNVRRFLTFESKYYRVSSSVVPSLKVSVAMLLRDLPFQSVS